MKHDIMTEITNNVKKYMPFYDNCDGCEYKVITSSYEYLERGRFTDSIVDVIVPASAAALRVNLYIYTREGQNILFLPTLCPGSSLDVYLKYDRMGGQYHGADHYTPLVLKKSPPTTVNQPITPSMGPTSSTPSVTVSNISSPFTSALKSSGTCGVQISSSAMGSSKTAFPPGISGTNISSTLGMGTQKTSNLGTRVTNITPPILTPQSNVHSGNISRPSVATSISTPSSSLPQSVYSQNFPHVDNVSQSVGGQDVSTGKKSVNIQLWQTKKNKKRSAKDSEDDGNDDYNIFADIMNGCEDDDDGYYFDEFGGTLDGSSSNKAPLERDTTPFYSAAEELMSFEVFAEIDREGTFIASQEDSDIEPEPEPQSQSQISTQGIGSEISSDDDEIRELPEKFRRTPRPKQRKWTKSRMRRSKCLNMEIEMVNEIPWDVDGEHRYVIFCEPDEFVDKSKDGRWYRMNTSSRKGLNGFRKTGTCLGSVLCQNIGCSKLQTEGVVNSSEFEKEYGCHICKCCGYYAVQIHCGCKKIIEYDNDTKELTVWYEGEHNCTPKPDTKAKMNYLESLPLKSSLRLTYGEMKNDCMRYFLSSGQYEKAMEVALKLNDPHLIEKMRFIQPGGNISDYAEDIAVAFSCIGDIKKELDKWDKYYIWAYNCGKTNGGDTFVFKTSKHHLETALKMDGNMRPLNGKRSMLSFEKTYFDGMHRRVRGFKTLTLWVHHPGLRRMKRLASMDCHRETKDMVALFFELFNSALRDYTGNPDYVFNPAMLVTDEAGAIHQGLHEVFGHEFLERISTCQWHFKRCAWRQIIHVREDDRATFRKTINAICKATTALEYELLAATMDEICRRNRIVRWWNWWKVRRYHLVPALRGFGWTGTNWAEIGHSKMKKNVRIWLISAVWEDVINACSEYAEWMNFVENRGKTIGKGPTVLSKKLKERRQMRSLADSIIDALKQGRIDADFLKHWDKDKHFIGSSSAKHRVPHSYPKNNPTQEAKGVQKGSTTEGKGKTEDRGRGRGKGRSGGQGRGRGKGSGRGKGRGRGWGGRNVSQKVLYTEEIETDSDNDVPTPSAVPEDVIVLDLEAEEDIIPEVQNEVPLRVVRNVNDGNPPRRNPGRKRRGKNWRYEDPDAYETDEELRPYDNLCPTGEQEKVKLAQNPPTYVFLRRPPAHLRPPAKEKGYKKYPERCNGCLLPFADNLYEPPLNLVFRFKTTRQWFDSTQGRMMTSKGPQNAYYHSADMVCLRRCPELELVTIENCYIEQACFAQLSEEQKNLLRKRKHWIPIRRNRAGVIDDTF